ncbi:MAG TPA: TonB family protein [Vicinamibacterales bacterium]|nr:TonB family protein [Vicinamibacterales bacterium]
MEVTDVLRDRMHDPAGLNRMIAVSVAVHVVLVAWILFAPSGLLGRPAAAPKQVMTISIAGGGEGASTGGMTQMASRPVQQAVPAQELPKREAVRPPAAKAPEMTVPTKNARPVTKAPPKAPDVYSAPDGAKGRTPTKGTEVSNGQSLAMTGARGQGFGLASGGGPGSGSSLDVADFCCPDYIVLMMQRIRAAWNINQGARGSVWIKFKIQRSGALTDVSVDTSSGNPVLDAAALRAVVATRTLPPLPDQYSNATLGVRLEFDYQ